MNKPIVVITPVKNEEWILERFLSVTSKFADIIIIADQDSNDNSKSICAKFPKVHLIQNESKVYDEAFRQNLLIDEARKKITGDKVLLALDADEILVANSLVCSDWKLIEQAKKGTVLWFEKPDLYKNTKHCIRYDNYFPLGCVDDGIKHHPQTLHSIRVPFDNYSPALYLNKIKFMHYGLTRLNMQQAKSRLYSMIENLQSKQTIIKSIKRRINNSRFHDYKSSGRLTKSPKEWFDYWEDERIEMHKISEKKFYSHDLEVMKLIKANGIKRFWFDDIFNDTDLERCRRYYSIEYKDDVPDKKIVPPPFILRLFFIFLDYFIKLKNK